MVMTSFSPALLVTVQVLTSAPSATRRVHGGLIQLSGL